MLYPRKIPPRYGKIISLSVHVIEEVKTEAIIPATTIFLYLPNKAEGVKAEKKRCEMKKPSKRDSFAGEKLCLKTNNLRATIIPEARRTAVNVNLK